MNIVLCTGGITMRHVQIAAKKYIDNIFLKIIIKHNNLM